MFIRSDRLLVLVWFELLESQRETCKQSFQSWLRDQTGNQSARPCFFISQTDWRMVEESPLGTWQTGGWRKSESRREKDLTTRSLSVTGNTLWDTARFYLTVSSHLWRISQRLSSDHLQLINHEFIAQTYKYSLSDLFHYIYVSLSVHKYMSAWRGQKGPLDPWSWN